MRFTPRTFLLVAVLCGVVALAVFHPPQRSSAGLPMTTYKPPTADRALVSLAAIRAPDGFSEKVDCPYAAGPSVCFLKARSTVLTAPKTRAWIIQSGLKPGHISCLEHRPPVSRTARRQSLGLETCFGQATAGHTAFAVSALLILYTTRLVRNQPGQKPTVTTISRYGGIVYEVAALAVPTSEQPQPGGQDFDAASRAAIANISLP